MPGIRAGSAHRSTDLVLVMTTDAFDSNRLLAEIGITEQEEHAYRLLLARGALAIPEMSAALHWADTQVAQLLAALESKGLVMRVPNPELRFLASPPEVAVEALILQKQVTLEQTRTAIAWLVREGEPSSPHVSATNCVEIVSGRGSLRRAHELLYSAVQCELRCLIPAASMLAGAVLERAPARASGVRCLRVVDATAIQDGTAVEYFRGPVAPLDECRFAQSLPLAVMIADRRLALLPLEAHNPQGPALLVRPSALLDGLQAMFEMVWGQATPVGFSMGAPAAVGGARSPLSRELEALIPLLAAGLNDKAIAHRLHISVRTLIRRVTKLLTVLDARSRFQAGWASALRLHGISIPNSAPAELSVPEGAANGIKGSQAAQRRAH
jgi:predicted DNA-binding transcriptional regulator